MSGFLRHCLFPHTEVIISLSPPQMNNIEKAIELTDEILLFGGFISLLVVLNSFSVLSMQIPE